MIKIKLHTLVEAKEPLLNLSTKELPLKTSYKLAKTIKKVNDELVFFEEGRLKLCQKYGNPSKEANGYKIPEDNMPKFIEEYNELLNIEVELDCEKVALPDTISIKPIDLLILDGLIEIEED